MLIWLMYALTLIRYRDASIGVDVNADDDEDAKRTLRHVQRSAFPDRGREFYGALSAAARMAASGEEDDGIGGGGGGDARGGGKEDDVDGAASWCRQSLGRGASVTSLVDHQMRTLVEVGLLPSGTPPTNTSVGGDAFPANPTPPVAAAASSVFSTAADAAPTPGGARWALLPSLGSRSDGRSSLHLPPSATIATKNVGTTMIRHPADVDAENESVPSRTDDDAASASSIPSSHRGTKRPLRSGSDRTRHPGNEGGPSGTIGTSLLRTRLELRKKLKMTDRTNQKVAREVGTGVGGKGGLRAILSQSVQGNDEENSDDNEDDGDIDGDGQIMAKRSADSYESTVTATRSSGSCASATSSNNGTIFHQDISPIDRDPTTSVKDMNLDYLLNWDPTKRDVAINKKKVTIAEDAYADKVVKKGPASVPKITRNDLAYMMNWNPFEKMEKKDDDFVSGGDGSDRSASVVVQRSTVQVGNQGKNMSTIDEATEGSTLGEVDKNGIASQSRSSVSSHESVEKITSELRKNKCANTSGDSSSRNDDEASRQQMISTSKLDCSFLPLIENKNIIRVKDEPYAKLGVIGKGGSCKVYRALSRDCNVVALKKVKLDGLNKQAVDGYANEIALLKRLNGNPAIIQLYSAEVDLERKSILLVMELGEVDLNYVLRQQELLSSREQSKGPGRSSLNMNFIRLTWQQMLTAVHSIHEERIIHSDLKPANFLFVRGALKLIDFGIAKAIEREDTTNVYRETLSGTLSYMSPEAIMDTSTNAKGVRVNKCGRPSDIWSLGCILYQMVYGKTPFANFHGIHQKVLAITNVNNEIPFPDGVDESAIDAMKQCLQRDPKQRPPIIGVNGLLNEHRFLHGRKMCNQR
ncbi:hypothetical protein ACHAXA_000257 [Cyclostephanos tholiformis]|uniref:Protein kinase domain-containing protein n=1 Tax=Cyclostephanos tholiformis TaxID=382380 RepID=A0ABD3SBQ3_9STRA